MAATAILVKVTSKGEATGEKGGHMKRMSSPVVQDAN